MRVRIAVFLLLLCGPALAQAPASNNQIETVHSTAPLTREETISLSLSFVQSLMLPSYTLDGQFTRWKQPLCPRVVGLTPAAAYVVERRIRDVAETIGAALDRADPCVPNIIVWVSPEPQATLDALVARERYRFTVPKPELRYPVQAWYFGFFQDFNGTFWPDIPWEEYGNSPPYVAANMTRLHSGLKPGLATANILVDAAAISGMTLGSLGDYFALMALAQAPATGRCQPAPSIANLFLANCEPGLHTAALSEVDLAMLKALYETPDEPERLQGIRLIANMRRNLEGETHK